MRLYLLIVLTIIVNLTAFAAIPPMISYQGKLTKADGTLLPDGTYSMRFAIYAVPTGGDMIWSEPNTSVQVKKGLFSVLLGSVVNLPGNIFDSTDRYFAVKVGDDEEMTPRQQIASVPFAFRAGSAANADNATTAGIADTVKDGAITSAKITDGAVTVNKISSNTIALACVKKNTDFSTTSINYVLVPGFSVTTTLPANGRMVKITVWCKSIQNITGGYSLLSIWDGPVGTGTQLSETCAWSNAHQEFPLCLMAIIDAPSGTHTFNVGLRAVGGEAYISMGSNNSPGFILVEAL